MDIIILLLLFVLVVIDSGKALGFSLTAPADKQECNGNSAVTLAEARQIFADATALDSTANGVYEARNGRALLGFVMKSSPFSDKINGFMGPTPLLIGLDADSKVKKVVALKNNESPKFFSVAIGSGLLDTWNGLTPQQATNKTVDAVSGATYSSKAIIGSMRARLAATGNNIQAKGTDLWGIVADAALVILVVLTLIGFFRPSVIGKKRNWLLLASIIVLGLWQGRLLSMAQFTVWVTNGIPLPAQWGIFLVLLLAVGLPLFLGKAYYCSWLCPMGSAQMLLGEINKKHKIKINKEVVKWLQILRSAILFCGLLIIGIGISFDFSDYEAFTVFHPQSAPLVALVIALISLALSIWVARPWCRFLCPLGELLEIVRKKNK